VSLTARALPESELTSGRRNCAIRALDRSRGDSVTQRRFTIIAATALACLLLEGCAAVQVQENTLEMVDSVAHVRESQVLSNLSSAISDHNMVPTEILLSVGQATVAAGLSPTAKFPKFTTASPTRELDVGATDTWTAQWQVTPVTNADDLRRLRNLYVLIVSTDEQYDALEAYYTRHPEMRAPIECYGLSAAGSEKAILVPPTDQCPPGYGTGVIPRWKQSLQIIESGDSIGCKMFQEGTVDARRKAPRQNLKGLPFKRWFYWRSPGSHTWLPETPDSEPETLGTYGSWELGTTSRACFNDFVIIVQSVTPDAASAAQGPKLMLNTP
jgi:hypothetical protein